MELILANSAAITAVTSANNSIQAASTYDQMQTVEVKHNKPLDKEDWMAMGFLVSLMLMSVFIVELSLRLVRR